MAYAAVVLVSIAAQRDWRPVGAALTLGATVVSSIGLQKLPESWTQVLADATIIAVHAVLAPAGHSQPIMVACCRANDSGPLR